MIGKMHLRVQASSFILSAAIATFLTGCVQQEEVSEVSSDALLSANQICNGLIAGTGLTCTREKLILLGQSIDYYVVKSGQQSGPLPNCSGSNPYPPESGIVANPRYTAFEVSMYQPTLLRNKDTNVCQLAFKLKERNARRNSTRKNWHCAFYTDKPELIISTLSPGEYEFKDTIVDPSCKTQTLARQ